MNNNAALAQVKSLLPRRATGLLNAIDAVAVKSEKIRAALKEWTTLETQKNAADRLGISPAYLNDIIAGRRDVSVQLLKKIATSGLKDEVRSIPVQRGQLWKDVSQSPTSGRYILIEETFSTNASYLVFRESTASSLEREDRKHKATIGSVSLSRFTPRDFVLITTFANPELWKASEVEKIEIKTSQAETAMPVEQDVTYKIFLRPQPESVASSISRANERLAERFKACR